MKLKSVKTRIKTWKRQLLAMLLIVIMLAGIMPTAYAYRYDVTPDCPDFSEVVWESTGTNDDGFTGTVSYADRDSGKTLPRRRKAANILRTTQCCLALTFAQSRRIMP